MEFTAEQLNYFRICHIAFNLVPEGLRKVFKQEWDFRYKATPLGEWKDSPQNGRDFYNNEPARNCTKNARYLAVIQNGNTAEWDCSCLFFAILYSDSIGTTLSPTVNEEVDELRQVRNGIAHISEAELTDAEFQNYVVKVLAAFNSLKLPVIATDIEEVKNQTSFPTAEVRRLKMQADNFKAELKNAKSDLQTKEEEVKTLSSDLQVTHQTLQIKQEEVKTLTQEINSKVESFCSLPFKPSHEIIRRSNDVTRMMKKLEELENKGNGLVSCIYLSGIPGCGKSQIARQVGQEFFDKRSHDSKSLTFVATLNAETLETLADSYMSLARQLRITEYTLTNLTTSKVGTPKETIKHLKRLILPQMKRFSNWLIIADNVSDLSLVRSDLPPTASEEWGHGQVIITIQDTSSVPSNAPHMCHESLSGGMQPDDAVELLRLVSQISNQEEAVKVAEVLEYQPLALASAACYVHTVVTNGSPNYSWANYLESFGRGEREATEEPLAKQNSAYSRTMTTAIKMAINRALESDEVHREAFCLFSLCASDSLPIEAVVNFVNCRTTGQTEQLIRAKLLKSSLITCSHGEDGVPFYLRVHNIVHEVLKTMLASNLKYKDIVQCVCVAIKIFHSLIEADKKLLFASGCVCTKLRRVTTHCKVLLEILTAKVAATELVVNELTPFTTLSNLVSWLSSTASVCCDLSNPSDANLFSASACDFVNYLCDTPEGKLLKAEAFVVHGGVLSLMCEYESSLSYYKQAITIQLASCGEDHPCVASSYNKLGNVYGDLGQHHQAKEYHEKALIIRTKIHGEHHADVADSYNNLGVDYIDLSQYTEAKEHHEKALVIRKAIHGEQHADVASSYNNLGVVYRDLGQYRQAREHHEKALVIRKKVYGEQHADVASSYNNVGVVYNDIGQYSRAKEHHEKARIIRKQIYGEQHADVATSYDNIGLVYSNLGQYNQAEKHHEKALLIRKKVYGEQHADVADTYNNLGIVYSNLGQQNEAKEHHLKAMSIRKKVYGEQHANVADSYNNLGIVYCGLKQYILAKECHEKALAIYKKVYGNKHVSIERSCRRLTLLDRHLAQHNLATKNC